MFTEPVTIKTQNDLNMYICDTFIPIFLSEYFSKGINLILLDGSLGAGKTTFTQIIGKYLQIPDIISSPTFTYYKKYNVDDFKGNLSGLCHYDIYRMNEDLEFDEKLSFLNQISLLENIDNKNNLVIVEWASKASEIFSEYEKLQIFISVENEGRKLIFGDH
jgi:tRNA threonylcarbamoyladenosine biosynthesis protein TsaE